MMNGYIEFLDGQDWRVIYSFSGAGCGYDFNFPGVNTTSIRLTMTGGGGNDNTISWYGYGSDGWKVYAKSTPTMTTTPTPTVTTTPTPTVTTTPTPTVTTTPTPTVTTPKINRRAKLKASYEIGSNNNRIEISVKIGDATASFIEAIINNPAELDPRLIYGGKQSGSIITWSGDLAPGEMHEIKYSTAVVKDQDIRVPIEIKYTKMSGAEKAQMLGMTAPSNMKSAKALMAENDWDKLDLVIVILKSLSKLPGFEILFGIVGIFLIYIIKKLGNRI